jgi:hypothetical protein
VRRFLVILCLLLNLSVLLMPFDTTHAHVSSAADLSTDVHSGHSHDLDHQHDLDHDHALDHGHDHETGTADHVVDLQAAVSAQNSLQSMAWSDWIPLACLVVLTFLAAQRCIAVFAPPSSDPKPASRRGYWRPPLRGPPAFSIR